MQQNKHGIVECAQTWYIKYYPVPLFISEPNLLSFIFLCPLKNNITISEWRQKDGLLSEETLLFLYSATLDLLADCATGILRQKSCWLHEAAGGAAHGLPARHNFRQIACGKFSRSSFIKYWMIKLSCTFSLCLMQEKEKSLDKDCPFLKRNDKQ